MLEKFIQLIETQAQVYAIEREIESATPYHICALSSVQLMTSAQPLFDGFCEQMGLTPKVEIYPWEDSTCRTQEVFYKNIRVLVHERDYQEESK